MTLSFYTWSEFEKNCGYSRLYGGVNFPDAVANIRYSTVILEKKMKLFTKFGKYEFSGNLLYKWEEDPSIL